MLPASAESRRGEELVRREFPGQETTRIIVILDFGEGSPLAAPRVAELYDVSRWLAKLPGVQKVESFVDLDPVASRWASTRCWRSCAPPARRRSRARWPQTMGRHIALLAVHTASPASSDEARNLVRLIRETHPPVQGRLLVTGHAAFDIDFLALVRLHAPRAVALIVVATYIVLFMLLRLGAAARQGRAHELPVDQRLLRRAGLDLPGRPSGALAATSPRAPSRPPTPLVMFCVIFGLSMDYGVLLLARIREEYLRTGDNTLAVARGAGAHRPPHHRRRRHHGRHLLRLRAWPTSWW